MPRPKLFAQLLLRDNLSPFRAKVDQAMSIFQRPMLDGSNYSRLRVMLSLTKKERPLTYQEVEISTTETFKYGNKTRLQHNSGRSFTLTRSSQSQRRVNSQLSSVSIPIEISILSQASQVEDTLMSSQRMLSLRLQMDSTHKDGSSVGRPDLLETSRPRWL
jgi:hypothetical protein